MKTKYSDINFEELKKGGVVKLREKDMFSVMGDRGQKNAKVRVSVA